MIIHDGCSIDAVVGVRSWRIKITEGVVQLRSMYRSKQLWFPHEVVTAECGCAKSWRSAGLEHRCGIYAWKEPRSPFVGASFGEQWLTSPLVVHGEVCLWGDVRVHRRGYRGQHALMSAIYVHRTMPDDTRTQAELTAIQYELPVVMISG